MQTQYISSGYLQNICTKESYPTIMYIFRAFKKHLHKRVLCKHNTYLQGIYKTFAQKNHIQPSCISSEHLQNICTKEFYANTIHIFRVFTKHLHKRIISNHHIYLLSIYKELYPTIIHIFRIFTKHLHSFK